MPRNTVDRGLFEGIKYLRAGIRVPSVRRPLRKARGGTSDPRCARTRPLNRIVIFFLFAAGMRERRVADRLHRGDAGKKRVAEEDRWNERTLGRRILCPSQSQCMTDVAST